MSLINDALRRASQAHREHEARRGAPPGSARTPSPAAELSSLSPPWASRLLAWAAGVILLGLLAGGAWYGWRTWVRPPAIEPVHPKVRPASVPVLEAPSAVQQPIPTVTQNVTSALPPSLAVTHSVAARAPVIWPRLKLQGIIYKPSHPSVVVNNTMLYVEDDIEGAKVVEIGTDHATLTLGGETNVLYLR